MAPLSRRVCPAKLRTTSVPGSDWSERRTKGRGPHPPFGVCGRRGETYHWAAFRVSVDLQGPCGLREASCSSLGGSRWTTKTESWESWGSSYDAAVDPGRWPLALQGLSVLLGSSAATLLFGDARTAAATISESIGIDRQRLVRRNEYYVNQQDVRLWTIRQNPGAIILNSRASAAPFDRTEFFNDLLPDDRKHLTPPLQRSAKGLIAGQRAGDAWPFPRSALVRARAGAPTRSARLSQS